MHKPKGFLFEDKDVIAADKKYFVAFWTTSVSAVVSGVISILLVATIFINNPSSQMITMVGGAIAVVAILLLGSIAMNVANDEFSRAAQLALQKHMLEKISNTFTFKGKPRS